MVEQEIQQIVQAIPDIRWLRIVSVDGVIHPVYRFDAGSRENTALELSEYWYSAMTAASLSLSDRICAEMTLGDSRFSIIAGKQRTHFRLPLGDGSKWVLSFVVRGEPAIDPIIGYFEDRNYLAHLIPLLSS